MKVVILGGYGVFGSRLAALLVRDGHDVWLAGRRFNRALSAAKEVVALVRAILRIRIRLMTWRNHTNKFASRVERLLPKNGEIEEAFADLPMSYWIVF